MTYIHTYIHTYNHTYCAYIKNIPSGESDGFYVIILESSKADRYDSPEIDSMLESCFTVYTVHIEENIDKQIFDDRAPCYYLPRKGKEKHS